MCPLKQLRGEHMAIYGIGAYFDSSVDVSEEFLSRAVINIGNVRGINI
jgi:hypothetical protein